MLDRFNVLPTALMTGRYKNTPCSDNLIESLAHVLFHSRFYSQACLNLLESILADKLFSEQKSLKILLAGVDQRIAL